MKKNILLVPTGSFTGLLEAKKQRPGAPQQRQEKSKAPRSGRADA
jgi:hypothetical protein